MAYTSPQPTTGLLGGAPNPDDLFNFWDVTAGYMKSVQTSTLNAIFGGGGGGGGFQISNDGGVLVPPIPTTLDFSDGLEVGYISAGVARANIKDGSVINPKLANMAPNTVKVNNGVSPSSPTDLAMANNTVLVRSGGNIESLAMTNNTVLGRAGSTNIAPLPIQDVLVGVGIFNASGIATIVDSRITVASIGCPTNRAGAHAGAIIHQQSVLPGSMTFQSNIAATGEFNYQIYII